MLNGRRSKIALLDQVVMQIKLRKQPISGTFECKLKWQKQLLCSRMTKEVLTWPLNQYQLNIMDHVHVVLRPTQQALL